MKAKVIAYDSPVWRLELHKLPASHAYHLLQQPKSDWIGLDFSADLTNLQ